jgi:diacylglycerol O-acyltransferase / wax synthase
MQQLSGQDASFLYSETPNAHMAGAGLWIYDPSTAPGGSVSFEAILENIRQRLHLARSFRQRLARVPMDLDHPYWIEDPDFDLEFHVREIALPSPGNWQQLCTQAARLLSRPLDLTRPLWEFYVIEGLNDIEGIPPGSFAIFGKTHHAAIDGMSGMDMMTAIHDHEPDAPPPTHVDDWKPETEPSQVELLARASMNLTMRPMRLTRTLGRTVPVLRPVLRTLRRDRPQLPMFGVPQTIFNGPVTPHRVIDGRKFDLADMKRMKSSVEGGTVNDVVLTVVGGALRDYLLKRGELPEASLVAMCPISVRTEAERSIGGNLVSAMFVPLGTNVADPLKRLETVRDESHRSKAFAQAIGARTLTELSDYMPGALMGIAARMSSRLGIVNRSTPIFNTTVTNMPGPQHPLYSCGARLVGAYGLGMIVDGMALIHPVISYCGEITITFTSCREILPDADTYADCLQRSFDELAGATT